MKVLRDPSGALAGGLAAIRTQFKVPDQFPAAVLAEADAAAAKPLTGLPDWTDQPFITLDPASSTDLDQAFHLREDGSDIVLAYAIAHVGFFVAPGSALEREAWTRGTTSYFPDERVGVYPPVLSENAASLLPEGPRPSVVLTCRVAADGTAQLENVTPAVIRSRAKLGYETLRDQDLPPLLQPFARRLQRAEDARGASRIEAAEQEVDALPNGGFTLNFRDRHPVEDWNAMLSLAANLSVAQLLLDNATGLFRVMAPPSPAAIARLRRTARGLGLTWPANATLSQFERKLDASRPADAAFIAAQRRSNDAAGYAEYAPGEHPWHAALGAPYAHATAPLRRLADRYVIDAVTALSAGRAVPDYVEQAFAELPKIMDRADARDSAIDRAIVDLAEAVVLHGREGEIFQATVIDSDERGARIQLRDEPVIARLRQTGLAPGADVMAKLEVADPSRREVRFLPA